MRVSVLQSHVLRRITTARDLAGTSDLARLLRSLASEIDGGLPGAAMDCDADAVGCALGTDIGIGGTDIGSIGGIGGESTGGAPTASRRYPLDLPLASSSSGSSRLEGLPDVVLWRIASMLPTRDRVVLGSAVSRALASAAGGAHPWVDVDLSPHAPRATDASVMGTFLRPGRGARLGGTFTERLNLWGCSKLSSATITRCLGPALRQLDLGRCAGVDEAVLAAIAKGCPGLESLGLWNCDAVDDRALLHLSQLPHLVDVDLGHCSRLTDDGLLALARGRSDARARPLCRLKVTWCFRLTDAGIAAVIGDTAAKTDAGPSAPSISARVYGEEGRPGPDRRGASPGPRTPPGPSPAPFRAGLFLDVTGCALITDALVEHVARRGDLISIRAVSCTLLTDRALDAIASMPRSVRAVDVSLCKAITSDGVRAVTRSCPRLEVLALEGCHQVGPGSIERPMPISMPMPCGGAAVATVHSSPAFPTGAFSLRKLSLAFCSQIDEATVVGILAHAPFLEELDLRWITAVGPNTVATLRRSCPRISKLDVRWCDAVADADIAPLRDAGCQVRHSRASSLPSLG